MLTIDVLDNEIIIKGDKSSLLELSNYIKNIALSQNEKNHIHLDDLTIIDKKSKLNLIIEKDSNN